jgi:16S rRNA (guanine527-N7)-methyltransferase
LESLKPLYAEWNEKINVISRKDIDLLEERHILHSLGIAKVIQFKKGSKILDVGTGGGFPGIPLAILFPESDFLLVDTIGKKIKVVNEVISALGLTNVTGRQQAAIEVKEKFDFIVSRAVTGFPEFHKWVQEKVSRENKNALKNGILYLKGGDLKEEFGKFYDQAKFYDLKEFFEEEFFETKKVVYYKL